MSYVTSGVYAAWRGLYRLLSEVTWPSDEGNDTGVAVWFGDSGPDWNPNADIPASLEKVCVIPAIEASQQESGPIGQLARDEVFNVIVQVVTAIPGRDAIVVASRLEELTAAVENALRGVLADGRQGIVLDEFAGHQVAIVQCGAVSPLVTPGTEGPVGRAEVVVGCKFRPGTTPTT
jgi:hypothetical protein